MMNDYQKFTETTAQYPKEQAIFYLSLGLAGEAGELANKIKKIIRGDYDISQIKNDLIDELGDVLWYIARLADELDITLEEVALKNIQKLSKRLKENKIKGTGDKR